MESIKLPKKEEKKMKLTHFGAIFAMIDLGMLSFADGYSRRDLLQVYHSNSADNFGRLVDCFSTATIGRDELIGLLHAICREEN